MSVNRSSKLGPYVVNGWNKQNWREWKWSWTMWVNIQNFHSCISFLTTENKLNYSSSPIWKEILHVPSYSFSSKFWSQKSLIYWDLSSDLHCLPLNSFIPFHSLKPIHNSTAHILYIIFRCMKISAELM